MKYVRAWFLKHQERQERFSSLSDLMFSDSMIRYPLYRLSLFNFQIVVLFITHAALFFYMREELPKRTFTFLIYVSSWKILLTSFWWGGLEGLRANTRYSYRVGQHDEINKIIGFWIVFALVGITPFVGFSIYYAYECALLMMRQKPIIEPLFVLVTLIGLAVQFPISCYHGGIYGITRIIRPHFSVILSNVLSLSVLLLTFPLINVYAIPLAIFVQSLSSTCLTFYYTTYMYKLYDFWPVFPNKYEFRRYLKKIPFVSLILAGLSSTLFSIDGFLVIVFYFFALRNPRLFIYLEILYLVSPLIRASSDWSRLFYFDRKKLENNPLKLFIAKYDRVVEKVAFVMGATLGLYAMLASYVLISPRASSYVLMLFPFFLLRSMVANQQVHRFCFFYFLDVIASGLTLTFGIPWIFMQPWSLFWKSFAMTLLMIIVLNFLKKPRLHRQKFIKDETLYTNLYAWLTNIKESKELTEITKLTLDTETVFKKKIFIISKLVEDLGLKSDQICIYGAHCILFARPISSKTLLYPDSFFAEIGEGAILNIQQDLVFTNQAVFEKTGLDFSYIDSPILRQVSDSAFKYVRIREKYVDQDQLKTVFFSIFENGVLFDPYKRFGPKAKNLDFSETRKFTTLILQYLYNKKQKSSRKVDLTVFIEEGVIQTIFVVPLQQDDNLFYEKLKRWHAIIHAMNVKRAMEILDPGNVYKPKENNSLEEAFLFQS